MNRLVDFWDQPTAPQSDGAKAEPILSVTGIPAKIQSLWANTQARKLPQQVVTETTHKIIIRYRPGLRSRMFILYNDPDSKDDSGNLVPRRFDIDSINDPDEHKQELQILAIERNDGQ